MVHYAAAADVAAEETARPFSLLNFARRRGFAVETPFISVPGALACTARSSFVCVLSVGARVRVYMCVDVCNRVRAHANVRA